jgi:uncharacterized protein YyaL (SSP411 family)
MPNRLIDSQSLYLRKHAHNPIDWWPWCDEAIALARRENRPIFLSIGYSSCHWCTVMEGEAFSDPAIAAYLNAHFVPIKVDREERPDIDSIYMQALQMMVGQGGWPLNVVLAPADLVPFYGGTYFPVEPRYGRPGFLQVLQALYSHYHDNSEQVAAIRAQIFAQLQQSAALGDRTEATDDPADAARTDPANSKLASTDPTSTDPANPNPARTDPARTDPANTDPASTDPASTDPASTNSEMGADLDPGAIADVATGLATVAAVIRDSRPGPQFPNIPYAIAALHQWRDGAKPLGSTDPFLPVDPADPLAGDRQRGLNLALGGIFDHVGGGFHRYAVDPTWTVPHFEKMLYDNGQILEYLAQLWAAGIHEPAFGRAIAETVNWLRREMTDPAGCFYAAQDADSFATPDQPLPEEGAFYCWTYDELVACLGQEGVEALATAFDITPQGNFEGAIVLQRTAAGGLKAAVSDRLDALFAQRYGILKTTVTRVVPVTTNDAAQTYTGPGRIPPVTDPKAIVAWNALAISGLARTAAVLRRTEDLDLAIAAAEFCLRHQWQGDRLYRLSYDGTPAVLAQSEDYALLIKALLDLQQACVVLGRSGDRWHQAARDLQTQFDAQLWSSTQGGYYNAVAPVPSRGGSHPETSSAPIIRERSYIDSATPAANGIAIANLVRLFILDQDPTQLDRAGTGLLAFRRVLQEMPRACPSLWIALDWFQHPIGVRTTPEIAAELGRLFLPTVMITLCEDLPSGAIALVCTGMTCQEPARDRAHLAAQLSAALDQRSGNDKVLRMTS